MKRSPYEKPIKGKEAYERINFSTFSFLIMQYVRYEAEKKQHPGTELRNTGRKIGPKLYEMIMIKEEKRKRDIEFNDLISFIRDDVLLSF